MIRCLHLKKIFNYIFFILLSFFISEKNFAGPCTTNIPQPQTIRTDIEIKDLYELYEPTDSSSTKEGLRVGLQYGKNNTSTLEFLIPNENLWKEGSEVLPAKISQIHTLGGLGTDSVLPTVVISRLLVGFAEDIRKPSMSSEERSKILKPAESTITRFKTELTELLKSENPEESVQLLKELLEIKSNDDVEVKINLYFESEFLPAFIELVADNILIRTNTLRLLEGIEIKISPELITEFTKFLLKERIIVTDVSTKTPKPLTFNNLKLEGTTEDSIDMTRGILVDPESGETKANRVAVTVDLGYELQTRSVDPLTLENSGSTDIHVVSQVILDVANILKQKRELLKQLQSDLPTLQGEKTALKTQEQTLKGMPLSKTESQTFIQNAIPKLEILLKNKFIQDNLGTTLIQNYTEQLGDIKRHSSTRFTVEDLSDIKDIFSNILEKCPNDYTANNLENTFNDNDLSSEFSAVHAKKKEIEEKDTEIGRTISTKNAIQEYFLQTHNSNIDLKNFLITLRKTTVQDFISVFPELLKEASDFILMPNEFNGSLSFDNMIKFTNIILQKTYIAKTGSGEHASPTVKIHNTVTVTQNPNGGTLTLSIGDPITGASKIDPEIKDSFYVEPPLTTQQTSSGLVISKVVDPNNLLPEIKKDIDANFTKEIKAMNSKKLSLSYDYNPSGTIRLSQIPFTGVSKLNIKPLLKGGSSGLVPGVVGLGLWEFKCGNGGKQRVYFTIEQNIDNPENIRIVLRGSSTNNTAAQNAELIRIRENFFGKKPTDIKPRTKYKTNDGFRIINSIKLGST